MAVCKTVGQELYALEHCARFYSLLGGLVVAVCKTVGRGNTLEHCARFYTLPSRGITTHQLGISAAPVQSWVWWSASLGLQANLRHLQSTSPMAP